VKYSRSLRNVPWNPFHTLNVSHSPFGAVSSPTLLYSLFAQESSQLRPLSSGETGHFMRCLTEANTAEVHVDEEERYTSRLGRR
jgi:hypothetical protein